MSTKPKRFNADYSVYLEDDPQPEPIPPKGRGISPGRNRNGKYQKIVDRAKAQPGTDLLIAILPANTKSATARARQVATAMRATLGRYEVVVTERKLDDVYKVWATYTNGTTPE